MNRTVWGFCIAALLLAWVVSASAQERPDGKQSAGQAPPSQQQKAPAHEPGLGAQLAKASNAAAAEGEENAEFKYSPSVHWFAGILHTGLGTAYWISVLLNFAVIAVIVAVLWRANVPAMFRQRTAGIQKSMEEATRASEDAARRLTEIEKRLAQLDANIAGMQQQAERESAQEEERLRASAGEEAQRIFQAAEQEIAAAAKAARRDLVAFAADLSVSLAQKRMHVDPQADQALVRSFARELGSNSFAPAPDGGKDGR